MSPHLLAHADTLVDFLPWGEEAPRLARERQQPILVSLGSASCHHTQVMLRECFSHPAVAKRMNAHFVCVKVDKNERPDLDRSFQRIAAALSGRGGWPLTLFLTPDLEPFFMANFLPREDSEGRPGYFSLLKRVSELWTKDQKTLIAQSQHLSEHLKSLSLLPPPRAINEDSLRAAESALRRDFDPSFGGFGRAPKFPPVSAISLLLRRVRRTNDPQILQIITRTLDGMMTGGLYDHLGGGFFRYSVDQTWSRPHFEKLLAENALLGQAYLETYQLTHFAPYRRVAIETFDFLLREMQSPEGGFFTSLSAESENEEGKHYLFTKAEVETALGQPSAAHFCEFFGITDQRSLPQVRKELSAVATQFSLSEESLRDSLEDARTQLSDVRKDRPSPGVEDTLLVADNGLTIGALAHAALVLGEDRYLRGAQRAAQSLLFLSTSQPDQQDRVELFRVARSEETRGLGFLDDYASLSKGLLALYEAGGGTEYLALSTSLAESLLTRFDLDGTRLKFSQSNVAGPCLPERITASDTSVGSEQATVVWLLSRLAVHTARPEWRKRAETLALSFGEQVRNDPRSHCDLLGAVDSLLDPPFGVLIGSEKEPEDRQLTRALFDQYDPNLIVAHGDSIQGGSPTSLSEPCSPGSFSLRLIEGGQGMKITDLPSLNLGRKAQEQWRSARRGSELGRTRLPGRATSDGTEAHSKSSSLPASAYTKWGELTVSRLGLGAHRLGTDSPLHREAVSSALSGGINLVDTSPSFALGESERVIGDVLAELIETGTLRREGLVVISKVGVHLGDEATALAVLSQTEEEAPMWGAVPLQTSGRGDDSETTIDPEELRKGAYCLAPPRVRSQITRSLERLGLAHLDFCLVQSPEHFLSSGGSREDLRTRLLGAFSTLEEEVAAGRVGGYGVQSNTLTRSEQDGLHLDLTWLLSIAEEAAEGPHHFRLVEIPVNLIEREALSNTEGPSFVQTAEDKGVEVLATRPLTCFTEGALLRLAEPKASEDGASADSLKAARYKVASLEAEFETTFAVRLRLSGQADSRAVLPVSGPLGGTLEKVRTREQFELAEATLFTPQLRHLISQLDDAFSGSGSTEWKKFRTEYIKAVGAWLAAVRETASEENRRLLSQVDQELGEKAASLFPIYEKVRSKPWAERALRCVIGGDGISGALVGLRSVDQVEFARRTLGAK